MLNHQKIQKNVQAAIAVTTPGMGPAQKALLITAEVLRFGLLFARKVRLMRKRENAVPFAMGSVLDAAFGKKESVQRIARFVFGSVSIMRCSEDLILMHQIGKKLKAICRGKAYLVIKRDVWAKKLKKRHISPSTLDRIEWMKNVGKLQVRQFFKTIAEFFKRLALLALHLSDSYTAFKENTVSEVFIHGKDLWKMLTSEKSTLAKELKKSAGVVDLLLKRIGSCANTSILLKALALHAKIKQKLPDLDETGRNVERNFNDFSDRIEMRCQEIAEKYMRFLEDRQLVRKIPALFIPRLEKKFLIFNKGDQNDPDLHRFIESPKLQTNNR